MPSVVEKAKRALVKVLLALAAAYNVRVQVQRDSSERVVTTAFKRVALKVHPDKGGTAEDFRKLQEAKEKWETAKQNAQPPGRRGYAEQCRQIRHSF
jgi:tRNA G26 N,N-dimethylase Trm1